MLDQSERSPFVGTLYLETERTLKGGEMAKSEINIIITPHLLLFDNRVRSHLGRLPLFASSSQFRYRLGSYGTGSVMFVCFFFSANTFQFDVIYNILLWPVWCRTFCRRVIFLCLPWWVPGRPHCTYVASRHSYLSCAIQDFGCCRRVRGMMPPFVNVHLTRKQSGVEEQIK